MVNKYDDDDDQLVYGHIGRYRRSRHGNTPFASCLLVVAIKVLFEQK